MSNFNDAMIKRLRMSRLHGLRNRLLNDRTPIYPYEFKTVFEKIDFVMIERMWDDYKYRGQFLPKTHTLAGEHVKSFVEKSSQTARGLNEVYKGKHDVLTSLRMDDSERRVTLSRLEARHKSLLADAEEVKKLLHALSPRDRCFIRRPLELPANDGSPFGHFLPHELSQQFPWYYWWCDKYEANLLPTESMALKYLFLWQVESHLGLSERTNQDEMGWYPICSFGP